MSAENVSEIQISMNFCQLPLETPIICHNQATQFKSFEHSFYVGNLRVHIPGVFGYKCESCGASYLLNPTASSLAKKDDLIADILYRGRTTDETDIDELGDRAISQLSDLRGYLIDNGVIDPVVTSRRKARGLNRA